MVTQMVDTVVSQPTDGLLGGGALGGLILGSMFARNGMFGGGAVDGAAYGANAATNASTNQILQALNQSQQANATQLITQDVNRGAYQAELGNAATQSAIASSTLQNTISTLQGQTALTKDIMDSTLTSAQGHSNILGTVAASSADTNANINNARQGISDDIRNALGVIDVDLHSFAANVDRGINAVRDDVNRARFDNLDATHRAQVSAMQNAFELQKAITTDGDRTRDMMANTTMMELNREILEAKADHRHDRAVDALTITNNNNAVSTSNAMQQQLQAQAQQQQLAVLTNGLSSLVSHVGNLQNIVTVGRGNTIVPTATNV